MSITTTFVPASDIPMTLGQAWLEKAILEKALGLPVGDAAATASRVIMLNPIGADRAPLLSDLVGFLKTADNLNPIVIASLYANLGTRTLTEHLPDHSIGTSALRTWFARHRQVVASDTSFAYPKPVDMKGMPGRKETRYQLIVVKKARARVFGVDGEDLLPKLYADEQEAFGAADDLMKENDDIHYVDVTETRVRIGNRGFRPDQSVVIATATAPTIQQDSYLQGWYVAFKEDVA